MPPVKIAAPADRDGRDALGLTPRPTPGRSCRRDAARYSSARWIPEHGRDCRDRGTSKTVLYRYFDDQAGLYSAVAQRIDTTILERTLQTVNDIGDPHQRLAAMVSDYLDLLESDPEIYRFLERRRSSMGAPLNTQPANLCQPSATCYPRCLPVTAISQQHRCSWPGSSR